MSSKCHLADSNSLVSTRTTTKIQHFPILSKSHPQNHNIFIFSLYCCTLQVQLPFDSVSVGRASLDTTVNNSFILRMFLPLQ